VFLPEALAQEELTMNKPAAKSSDRRVMFDAEVAAFLGISKKTLQNRVARPVKGEIDLNAAKPQRIGSRRLWLREEVERLVGIKKGVTK
jgi:predicted DNA-binding transcriptional regulator AlpA